MEKIVITNGKPFAMDDNYILVPAEDGVYEVKGKQKDIRSLQQNRSLHMLFNNIANALNDAGLDRKHVIKAGIQWGPESVKNDLWRPLQVATVNKKSTTALKKQEIDIVYETLNRLLGEKYGIHVSFPSVDEMLLEKNYKEMK